MNEDKLDRLLDQMPDEMAPGRDLWPGIEARLTPHRRASRWQARWPLAVAAAVVAAVALGLVWRHPPSTTVPQPVAQTPAPRLTLPATGPETTARARFAADSVRHDPRLSPQTRAVVLRNLDLIEKAIANVKLALRGDPANPQLLKMLNQLYLDESAIIAAAQEAPSDIRTTRHSL